MESTVNYLEPQTLAKLQGLSLRARHVVDGYLSGAHRSAHHGFSAEFSQHRPYAQGDDLRHVDWKAFGRTDRLFVKQFVDETNLACTFLLDASNSMSYQSADAALSKFEYAGCLVAAMTWLLRNQGDAVGLATFASDLDLVLAAHANDHQIGRIINQIEATSLQTDTSIGTVMAKWSDQSSGRQLVVLVSDLFDEINSLLSSILNLQQLGHELIVIQICDPDEIEFPFGRRTQFCDCEGASELTIDAQVCRRGYLEQFDQFVKSIRKTLQRESIDFVQVVTDQNMGAVISKFLVARQRSRILGVH